MCHAVVTELHQNMRHPALDAAIDNRAVTKLSPRARAEVTPADEIPRIIGEIDSVVTSVMARRAHDHPSSGDENFLSSSLPFDTAPAIPRHPDDLTRAETELEIQRLLLSSRPSSSGNSDPGSSMSGLPKPRRHSRLIIRSATASRTQSGAALTSTTPGSVNGSTQAVKPSRPSSATHRTLSARAVMHADSTTQEQPHWRTMSWKRS